MSKIKYLRVIVNQECNLSCFFCHREGEEKRKRPTADVNAMIEMINLLIDGGINKVKFLGGEPTLCKNLPLIIQSLKESNPSVDYSMITNGVVETKMLKIFVDAGLNRINVSLHGFNKDIFGSVTGGNVEQLSRTLDSISYLNRLGVLGKINYVVLKGVNEAEFMEVLEYIHENDFVLDALNYLGTSQREIDKYYYSFGELTDLIKSKYELKDIALYNNRSSLSSTRLILKNGGVVNLKTTKLRDVNFLNGCSMCEAKQYCTEGISAIRLTPDGVIKPCIFRNDNVFNLKRELDNNGRVATKAELDKYLEEL